jgi:hypothetical protein
MEAQRKTSVQRCEPLCKKIVTQSCTEKAQRTTEKKSVKSVGKKQFLNNMIMKKLLLLSFAILLITGKCHAQTPPHAASTQTWTFGDQVWSDAIRIPECNKASFSNSEYTPECRSYTSGSETWYYYNWAYVDANKHTLCPSPWRVPSENDYQILVLNTTLNTLINAWALSGYASGSSADNVGESAYYWSSTEDGTTFAYDLYCDSGYLYVSNTGKDNGFRVRCVR